MRRFSIILVVFFMACLLAGCRQSHTGDSQLADSINVVDSSEIIVDSTIYGVCGDGTTMNTIELVTDGGDTLYFSVLEDDSEVLGGLMSGDRLAVVGREDSLGLCAQRMLNLTTLLGKWASIDKNFEIIEGGMVNSSVQAETKPWVSWKILNGQLLLNSDTFDIIGLGADSLYIENDAGIFAYKRIIGD